MPESLHCHNSMRFISIILQARKLEHMAKCLAYSGRANIYKTHESREKRAVVGEVHTPEHLYWL